MRGIKEVCGLLLIAFTYQLCARAAEPSHRPPPGDIKMPEPLDWIVTAIKAGHLTVPAAGDQPPAGEQIYVDKDSTLTDGGTYYNTTTITRTLQNGTCSGTVGVASVACDRATGMFSFQKTFHSVWSGTLRSHSHYKGVERFTSDRLNRGDDLVRPVGETRDYTLRFDCPLAGATLSIVGPGESTGADLINLHEYVKNFMFWGSGGGGEGSPPQSSTLPSDYLCRAVKNYGVKLSYPKDVVKIGFHDGPQYISFAILPCVDKFTAESLLGCLKQLQSATPVSEQ